LREGGNLERSLAIELGRSELLIKLKRSFRDALRAKEPLADPAFLNR
jgi:hypothetical protein